MVSPALLLLSVFFIWPLFNSFWISFHTWPMFGKPKWVGLDNYISTSPLWDHWMESYNGTRSTLDIKFEINIINSNSNNRLGPFSFDVFLGYKERLVANNTYKGWNSYIGITTFYQGW